MKKKKVLVTILIALVILLTLLIVFKVFYKEDKKEKVKSFDEQVLIRIENLYEYLNLYYFTSKEEVTHIKTSNDTIYYKIESNKYTSFNDIEELISNTFIDKDKYLNNLYRNTSFIEIDNGFFLSSLSPCNVDDKDNLTNYKTISNGKSKKEIQVNDIDITLELSNNKWLITNYDYECVGE